MESDWIMIKFRLMLIAMAPVGRSALDHIDGLVNPTIWFNYITISEKMIYIKSNADITLIDIRSESSPI